MVEKDIIHICKKRYSLYKFQASIKDVSKTSNKFTIRVIIFKEKTYDNITLLSFFGHFLLLPLYYFPFGQIYD